jgi:hypothetical protein
LSPGSLVSLDSNRKRVQGATKTGVSVILRQAAAEGL